jgi:hypothetical protein
MLNTNLLKSYFRAAQGKEEQENTHGASATFRCFVVVVSSTRALHLLGPAP